MKEMQQNLVTHLKKIFNLRSNNTNDLSIINTFSNTS